MQQNFWRISQEKGDARSALNAVELGILTTTPSADGKIHITVEVASERDSRSVWYGMIKAETAIMIPFPHLSRVCADRIRMRRSIIWLRMLYAGEDVKFIARRITDLCIRRMWEMPIPRHCRWQ